MPILDNPRHERFAQELAKGKSQAEAYEAAGYSPARSNAARLITNDSVGQRVAELQQRAAIRTEVTIESLTRELDEARTGAIGDGQFAAAVAAIREKAVLHGLRIEKSERKHSYDVDSLSDEELATIAFGGSASDPAPSSGTAKPH